ncbi:MAG: hypothetical protein Q9183_005405, partial [Haloplaca sp. 2 TL-2023]
RHLTNDEYKAELAKTKLQHKELKAQYSSLEAERDQWKHLQSQKTGEVITEKRRCEVLDTQLKRLKNEMRNVKERHSTLENEYKELQDSLNRATTTIQIQSKQIQGKVPSSGLEATPSRHRNTGPQYTPARHHNASAEATPSRRHDTGTERFAEDYGFGPKGFPPPGQHGHGPYQLQTPHRQTNHHQVSRLPAATPSSGALVLRPQHDVQIIPWATEFSALFAKVERFCRDFLNVPNPHVDRFWPVELALQVTDQSHSNQMATFAHNTSTRCLFLTRVIIGWIERDCLRSRLVRGFSKHHDAEMANLRHQAKGYLPPHAFQGMFQAEVNIIREIVGFEGFHTWKQQRLVALVDNAMATLFPIIAPDVTKTEVSNALSSLMEQAARLGVSMLTSNARFKFHYPSIDEPFQSRAMLNRDRYITGPPNQLEARHARVALAVTPHISMDDTSDGCQDLHLANVLLRL